MRRIYISVFLIGVLMISCNKSKKENIIESSLDINQEIVSEKTIPNVDVALQFINDYVSSMGELDINSNPLLSDSFKNEYSRMINQAFEEDPEYGLGFDPIVDGQDFPDKFELDFVDTENNYLVVKGIEWKDFKVTMKIKNQDGKWLIDGCGVINIPEEKQSKR